MAKIAFLGLGVMGYPMAGHLKAAGHDVTVYNRSVAKAESWVVEHGGGDNGAMASTPNDECVMCAHAVMIKSTAKIGTLHVAVGCERQS